MAKPSVVQKIQMGAMMGAGIGCVIGGVGGTFQGLNSHEPFFRVLGRSMLSSAGTFAVIMAVGSVLRQ